MAMVARLASAIGLRPPLEGKGLVTGGRVLALVGGDGAGKTTCATELTAWLGAEFATLRVHLGRPARSLATLAVGCALRVARWLHTGLAGHLGLLRCGWKARGRHRLYPPGRGLCAGGGGRVGPALSPPPEHCLCGPRGGAGVPNSA